MPAGALEQKAAVMKSAGGWGGGVVVCTKRRVLSPWTREGNNRG